MPKIVDGIFVKEKTGAVIPKHNQNGTERRKVIKSLTLVCLLQSFSLSQGFGRLFPVCYGPDNVKIAFDGLGRHPIIAIRLPFAFVYFFLGLFARLSGHRPDFKQLHITNNHMAAKSGGDGFLRSDFGPANYTRLGSRKGTLKIVMLS